ncbi:hypothetical protein TcasGA2_TC007052 [Tribolium castaneum]|uniref:Uncharacterized protein n=1 Tax=Tribolium castaneum TaxID=7070 RepID=D2A223_TRICA|nr:hypothetical protein TcasGA2_TC007052 [Tribolium castaneum]
MSKKIIALVLRLIVFERTIKNKYKQASMKLLIIPALHSGKLTKCKVTQSNRDRIARCGCLREKPCSHLLDLINSPHIFATLLIFTIHNNTCEDPLVITCRHLLDLKEKQEDFIEIKVFIRGVWPVKHNLVEGEARESVRHTGHVPYCHPDLIGVLRPWTTRLADGNAPARYTASRGKPGWNEPAILHYTCPVPG